MTGIAASASRSATSASSSSAGAKRTPTWPSCCASWACSVCQRDKLTITLPAGGIASSSATCRHVSSTSCRCLMSCIERVLERLHPRSAIAIDETLLRRGALLEVRLEDGIDRVDDLLAREGRADDLADRGVVAGRATQHQLIGLDALLVDAEHADVADVMVPAGVDAARHLEADLAQVFEVIEVVEALG